jgi:hypothetical protein
MPISKKSARVVALLKHAIEQCKDIAIDKPRVKHPTNRKWYHFDMVAVCKAWVEAERAYAEKVDRLTALAAASGCGERAAEVKAMIAERAPLMRNSCSRHLTLVRDELTELGYEWWEDFTDPELHLGNINKQKQVAKAKTEKGYFIRNNEAEYAWADANVDSTNISIADRIGHGRLV